MGKVYKLYQWKVVVRFRELIPGAGECFVEARTGLLAIVEVLSLLTPDQQDSVMSVIADRRYV